MSEGASLVHGVTSNSSPADRSPILLGYDDCYSEHLGLGDGTLVSRLSNRTQPTLSLTRTLPPDAFGAAVALDRQQVDIMHGDRMVRSGRLPVGTVSLQRPGQVTKSVTSGPWEVLFFYLPRSTIRRICEAADVCVDVESLEFLNPPASTEVPMLDFARRVRDEIGTTDAFARLRVDLITQQAGIHLLRHHSSVAETLRAGASKPLRGGLAPRQLRRVCQAMDGMLEDEVTLAALAAIAGCSATHFSRAFKQSTGSAPFAWLLNRRVERAKRLLEAGDLPIAEVALAVGFSAQPQFTTAFKRMTGVTPAIWRRQHADGHR